MRGGGCLAAIVLLGIALDRAWSIVSRFSRPNTMSLPRDRLEDSEHTARASALVEICVD